MTQAMVNLTFGRRLTAREGWGGEEDALAEVAGTRVSSWRKRGRERRAGPYLRKRAKRPRAPDNTTQFLMGDQGGARQSFSDSDLENSSESEDHFVEREFAKDYDNLKSEIQPNRQKLPKSKLIEEFMTVEAEVKMLEKKYAEMTTEEQLRARLGTTEFDMGEGGLSKKGYKPSAIGVHVRDQQGIAQSKYVTGSKILRILKAQGMAPELPEDLYFLIKKAVTMRKHLERNRKDKHGKFRMILVESRIHRLARYYKTNGVLASNWKYDSSTAAALVS